MFVWWCKLRSMVAWLTLNEVAHSIVMFIFLSFYFKNKTLGCDSCSCQLLMGRQISNCVDVVLYTGNSS